MCPAYSYTTVPFTKCLGFQIFLGATLFRVQRLSLCVEVILMDETRDLVGSSDRELTPAEAGDHYEYEYRTIEEAPPVHRDVCKYLAVGWSVKQVADFLSVKTELVHRVANHAPCALHIRHLEAIREQTLMQQALDMEGLFADCLARLREDVNHPATKPADRVRMAAFVADRLPNSRFVVQKRTEHRRVSASVTSTDMLKLSREAGSLGRPSPRDVTPGVEGLTTPNRDPSAAAPGPPITVHPETDPETGADPDPDEARTFE